MKIITTNHGLQHRFSIENQVNMIAKAGFDGIDFSDLPVESPVTDSSYKQYAELLNKLAQEKNNSYISVRKLYQNRIDRSAEAGFCGVKDCESPRWVILRHCVARVELNEQKTEKSLFQVILSKKKNFL